MKSNIMYCFYPCNRFIDSISKLTKKWSGQRLFSCLLILLLLVSAKPVFGDEGLSPYENAEAQPSGPTSPAAASSYSLPFDPINYNFMIYESSSSENSIRAALSKIGITNYTVCDETHPVTVSALNTHDILIVGWESGSDTTNKAGLNTNAIEQGITGRVILSGHDSDYHTVNVEAEDAGTTFFVQEIEYILNGGGTGLLVCADPQRNFNWLPTSWGITANNTTKSNITELTQDGLESGVYDGLDEDLMSGWTTTYHNAFTAWGIGFKVFELGEANTSQIGYDVVTIAAPTCPLGIVLTKVDDVADGDCREINEEIKYTIQWVNPTSRTFYNVVLKDVFPAGVTFPVEYTLDPNTFTMIPSDSCYAPETHTYVYPIGTIDPNDSGTLELTVIVNDTAESGMYLRNIVQLWDVVYDANGLNPTDRLMAETHEDTLMCCWDTSGILYVDKNATGNNTGVSWANAYTDLEDALARARETQCSSEYVIYVAQETYAPQDTENGFVVPEGVSVYGGFPTGGCDFAYRNPKQYVTTLTGLIDEETLVTTVVTMGDNTLLDGFTVMQANFSGYNVYGNGVDFTVSHCIIKDSYGTGIYAENGNVTVQWCTISENGATGLYHTGTGFSLNVDNSHCMRNGEYGVYCEYSTPTIRNSIISESSLSEQGRAACHVANPTYSPTLYNCTFANNKAQALFFEDNADASGDPNHLDYPDLQNSILYYNNNGGNQVSGFNPDIVANYCCVQDCNEVGTTNFNDEPGFAYTVDPNELPDPNNYHLSANSVCIDKGNLFLSYTNQVDIDGEGLDRKYGSAVDVGADEVYDCYDDVLTDADVHNDLDWNADGIVNLVEFNEFSAAWLSHDPDDPASQDPNLVDPNSVAAWNPRCNLNSTGSSTYTIDTADLTVFLNDWLWVACWKLEEINTAIAQSESMAAQSQSLMVESAAVERTLSAASLDVSSLESSSMTESTVEENSSVSAQTLTEIISILDNALLTETDNIEGIMQMKAILQAELDTLSAAESQ